jgi:hypothetical protein
LRCEVFLLAYQCVERRLLCGELRCELLLARKCVIKLIGTNRGDLAEAESNN